MLIQIVYNLFTLPLSILIGILFCFNARGRKQLRERFGIWDRVSEPVLWLHGASVGEVNGLLELIPGLREKHPDYSILLTATSTSGLERGAALADHVYLLPFDSFLWTEGVVRNLNVQAFIFGETEIWPALLHSLQKRKVPLYMVNATISDFTYYKYLFFRGVFKPVLSKLSGVAAANKESAVRLTRLGAIADSLILAGNTKYDRAPQIGSELEAREAQKSYFADNTPVVTLGSIRPGEESFWCDAVKEYAGVVNWIIAPRHKEKFSYFEKWLTSNDIEFSRWSEPGGASSSAVLLLDTMGKLEECYSFSSLVFIGATLIPGIGGHNPLEAAQYGVPVVMGEHYKNAQTVVDEMRDATACLCVSSSEEVNDIVGRLTTAAVDMQSIGERARVIAAANRGATERVLAMIA